MTDNTGLCCVIWRSGGTENFQWHRSLSLTKDDAIITSICVRRMGYLCFVEDYDYSISVGLPEGFYYDKGYSPEA